MSSITPLLPTNIAISGNVAIEAILADIPLFCEGIMGIGVFTFLFLSKQVKWLTVFLYGSSFMAFVAATLDLSQVLARGPDRTAKGIGLNDVAGFITAREIFLSLAFLSLNLYFWKLVAQCPRSERGSNKGNGILTEQREAHSSSWTRWGLLGMILKWASLAALLSAPLLQILWRLLPGQRQYSSIYVAESIIQTTVMVTFILKCILNIYLSPLDNWLQAFRPFTGPVASLLFGAALGIGNLILFSFTETSLGRFLRAVEVYILFLNSLSTAFEDAVDTAKNFHEPTDELSPGWDQEKAQFRNPMPMSYASPRKRQSGSAQSIIIDLDSGFQGSPVDRTPDWPTPRRMSVFARPQRSVVEAEVLSRSDSVMRSTPQLVEPNYILEPRSAMPDVVDILPEAVALSSNVAASESRGPTPLPPRQPTPASRYPTPLDRPATAASSYYDTEPSSLKMTTQPLPESPSPVDVVVAYADSGESGRGSPQGSYIRDPALLGDSRGASLQGSITSIDDLLRQQNELDKSIAALRLFASQPDPPSVPTSVAQTNDIPSDKSRSDLTTSFATSKTGDSPSRSEFSLSIFPEPPVGSERDGSAKEDAEDTIDNDQLIPTLRKTFRDVRPLQLPLESAVMSSATLSQIGILDSVNSAGTQYDVTSFIGDLTSTGPSSGITQMVLSADDITSDNETPTISTASAVALRPMYLAAAALSAGADTVSRPALSASTYPEQAASPSSSPDSAVPLRPLLLGRPMGNGPPLPGRMVPLAQRRERSGTGSSVRRPIISVPLLKDSEAEPGAFERPRPPPLLLR